MAVKNQDGPEITGYASGNLSSLQFHIMTLDTDGYIKQADDPDDAAEPMVGVLQNKPSAAGREAVVRIQGIAKVMSGATINEGTAVTTDGDGHAAAAVANDWVLGVAWTAGASGSLMEVLLQTGSGGGYVAPT